MQKKSKKNLISKKIKLGLKNILANVTFDLFKKFNQKFFYGKSIIYNFSLCNVKHNEFD